MPTFSLCFVFSFPSSYAVGVVLIFISDISYFLGDGLSLSA